ncbi:TPA: hypothetical protein SOL97_003325 [Clostridioides difficile]|nr:hypothetical protein [Clostridioides difficile]
MERCKICSVEYQSSDTINTQGKRSDIDKYIQRGYRITMNSYGNWSLKKDAKVYVQIENSSRTENFDMKYDIIEFYSRKRISETLVEDFKEDISSGIVSIYMDENGNYEIKCNQY